MTMKTLPKSFYERDTKKVAKELLGRYLIHKNKVGMIVETEAYYGLGDPASHASRGMTPRNKVMFGPAGRSYVYFIYGNYYLLNAVTEKEGKPGAVLIRALEPIQNIDAKTNGPARLTMALGITREHNDLDLTKGDLKITEGTDNKFQIIRKPRIGIKQGAEELLRFYIKNNKYISKT